MPTFPAQTVGGLAAKVVRVSGAALTATVVVAVRLQVPLTQVAVTTLVAVGLNEMLVVLLAPVLQFTDPAQPPAVSETKVPDPTVWLAGKVSVRLGGAVIVATVVSKQPFPSLAVSV